MTQLTLALSALGGAPASFSVAASFAWSQPSIFALPIVVDHLAGLPRHGLERQALLGQEVLDPVAIGELAPRAHEDVELAIGSLAATVIGVFAENSSSAGLT